MSIAVRKFHLVQAAAAGGWGHPVPEQESVLAAPLPPRPRIGITVTEVDPSTEAYDWRLVAQPLAAQPAPEIETAPTVNASGSGA